MDSSELFWRWLTGLVRRVSAGVLLYFLFATVTMLLFLSENERNLGLDELSRYSDEHGRFTEAFADIAGHATELSGSRSRAMSAIQPLRLSLISARDLDVPQFACAISWADGLQDLQTIPAAIAASCDFSDGRCQVASDDLVLEDLVAFERGIASVQDALQELDRFCNSPALIDSVCAYYLHQDNEIGALGQFVGSHYRERPRSADRPARRAPTCAADQTFLTGAAHLVTEIDPTARPRTLSDFERLGRTITDARVAIQSQDTRMSGAPPGGIMTVSIPKHAGLPALSLLGLLSALYAMVQIRRLRRLVASYAPAEGDTIYRLYPVASSAFTFPVFGRSADRAHPNEDISLHSRVSGKLVAALFDHIPVLALVLMIGAVAGLSYIKFNGGTQLSSVGIGISWAIIANQALVIAAFIGEQRAVRTRFKERIGVSPSGHSRSEESEHVESEQFE